MRVVVNPVLCQAHGACVEEAPEFFEVHGATTVKIKQATVPPELLDQVKAAVRFCPTGALELVEE